MGLTRDLGLGRLALDTSCFIYFIEEHPDYVDLVSPVFESADSGKRQLVTSALSLLEVLVVLFRAGDLALAARYETLLGRSRGLTLVPIDTGQLRAAAQLRAVHRVRTPDALQLTAALATRCSVFLTNDRKLPEISGLRILQLRDYL